MNSNRIQLLLGYQTAKGPVFIGRTADGRFHPLWKEETLGSYPSIAAALDDVAGGHCKSPADGTDLDSLEISADIGRWEQAEVFL